MKYKWLRCDGNSRLVLLFAGWGTDASYYNGITAEGWDVLVCYDFDDYEFEAVTTPFTSMRGHWESTQPRAHCAESRTSQPPLP